MPMTPVCPDFWDILKVRDLTEDAKICVYGAEVTVVSLVPAPRGGDFYTLTGLQGDHKVILDLDRNQKVYARLS